MISRAANDRTHNQIAPNVRAKFLPHVLQNIQFTITAIRCKLTSLVVENIIRSHLRLDQATLLEHSKIAFKSIDNTEHDPALMSRMPNQTLKGVFWPLMVWDIRVLSHRWRAIGSVKKCWNWASVTGFN